MDKLQVQATSFLLTKELPHELLEQLQEHKYSTLTDLVNKLIDEELESWQFCYIKQHKPEDQSIPEYIIASIDTETIIEHTKELIDSNKPPMVKENTPYTRDKQVVESAGGTEEYCEVQIELYEQVCAKSVQKRIATLLNKYSDDLVTEEEAYNIGKELTDEIGLWRWYLIRNNSEKGSPEEMYESETVCDWLIAEAPSALLDITDEQIPGKVDLEELSKEISKFEPYGSPIDVN